MVIEPLSLKSYYQDTLVATLVTPYDSAELPDINGTQSINQLYVFHPTVAPYILTRTAAHAGWTFAAITFSWFPTYDFDRNYESYPWMAILNSEDSMKGKLVLSLMDSITGRARGGPG